MDATHDPSSSIWIMRGPSRGDENLPLLAIWIMRGIIRRLQLVADLDVVTSVLTTHARYSGRTCPTHASSLAAPRAQAA